MLLYKQYASPKPNPFPYYNIIKFAKAENSPQIVIIAGPNGVGKSTLLETSRKVGSNLSYLKREKFWIGSRLLKRYFVVVEAY
jgi:predicted AAA+ superfamily ATPase